MRLVNRSVQLSRVGFRSLKHWAKIALAPPDKILGLNEAFKADPSPQKINLGVGAYRDNNGKPFVLNSVRKAEVELFEAALEHEYAGIAGVQQFIDLSLEFVYGTNAEVLVSKKVAAVQALSGTGACRLSGEFLAKFVGKGKKIYMPDPTWGNHIPIMKNSGLEPASYRYFDPTTNGVDFAGVLDDVQAADNGSIFMLHACAHNPTGCDPTKEQWNQLSTVMKAKKHVVFFDCAYQGFASGDSEQDAYAVRKFVEDGHPIILSQSFAKNFGLYGERIGTLSVVTRNEEEAERVLSQLKLLVRPMYSNPPLYGARLVAKILSSPALKEEWSQECKTMADRIITMRHLLRSQLEVVGSTRNWAHITNQIGMFCYTGLSKDQVLKLRGDFHIYCTEDGRVSMAGVNTSNVAYLASAIHAVTSTGES